MATNVNSSPLCTVQNRRWTYKFDWPRAVNHRHVLSAEWGLDRQKRGTVLSPRDVNSRCSRPLSKE
jgi:hypothetical protein